MGSSKPPSAPRPDSERTIRRPSRPPHGMGHEISASSQVESPVVERRVVPPRGVRRSVRGPILAGLEGGLARRFGEEARERVVALLPDDHALLMRRGPPSVLDAHDIDLLRIYCEIASRVFSMDAALFRQIGNEAVERELAPFLRTVILPGQLPEVLSRAIAMLARFTDFGTWTIGKNLGDIVTLRVDDFHFMTSLLRAFYLGIVEGIVRRSVSTDARVEDVTAADGPATRFEIEVSVT